MEPKQLGREGEALAGKFLEGLGFQILEKGSRTRLGEIDLIARDGETLVFIEVKTRTSTRFGFPEEAVTWQKQRKMAKVALTYIKAQGIRDTPIRFDVVSIQGTQIRHIPNAFEVSGYTQ